MTEPHHAVIARLSADFAAISHQLARVSSDLTELDRLLSEQPRAQPAPHVPPATSPYAPPPAPYCPSSYAHVRPHSSAAAMPTPARAAAAGTLRGLDRQGARRRRRRGHPDRRRAAAGARRPGRHSASGNPRRRRRVAGRGAGGRGRWLYARPGGRVGAIALAATGIAAAYMDVIAVTTIYDWVPAPVGLAIAAVIGGGGLTLARRWDSRAPWPAGAGAADRTGAGRHRRHHAAASRLHAGAVRRVPARPTRQGLDLAACRPHRGPHASVARGAGRGRTSMTGTTCGWPAPAASRPCWPSQRTDPVAAHRQSGCDGPADGGGVVPVLCVSLAVDRVVAALMAAALAAALLAIVLVADRLPGVTGVVRQIWSALSAISALIAVTVAFDGQIAGPVLLAMAVVVAVAGRRDVVARWSAVGFGSRRQRALPGLRAAELVGPGDPDGRGRWDFYAGRPACCWWHARWRSPGRG